MLCVGSTKTEVRTGNDNFLTPVCPDPDDCVAGLLKLTQFGRKNWHLVRNCYLYTDRTDLLLKEETFTIKSRISSNGLDDAML
jgi:hypothetical protein